MIYQDTYCWALPLKFDSGGRPQEFVFWKKKKKEFVFWDFPVIQWLTFHASNAEGTGSTLDEELRCFPYATQKEKKKDFCILRNSMLLILLVQG